MLEELRSRSVEEEGGGGGGGAKGTRRSNELLQEDKGKRR